MIDWFPIPISAAGRMAIVARPRGNDWLQGDVAAWKKRGITTVVSLLEADEAASLGLDSERQAVEQAGMNFIQFPISDRGIPQRKDSFVKLIEDLAERIAAGESAAIHCRQSIGRAPLTAIGVLQSLGQTIESAVQSVSKARGRPVPETMEQRRWLEQILAAESLT